MIFFHSRVETQRCGELLKKPSLRLCAKLKNFIYIHLPHINYFTEPKKNLDKIFMPFYTTKDPGKGTGLGLSLCETIVSAHGGKLSIDSEEGKGTTLTLRLPGPASEVAGAGALG